ncbi:universal stress protein [Vibrio cincinnatiensis]|jgi:nucleotide-binding universal stress UspA family protein|nr:universal stress protein [Vibrio cincinnatiensis]MCG3721724.1 hypothetical protein [Vibrio cincinnatiensis]
MNKPDQEGIMYPFNHILYVCSEQADEHALAHAVHLATNSQAKLSIIYVLEKDNHDFEKLDEIEHSILVFQKDKITRQCQQLAIDPLPQVHLVMGKLYLEVIRTALREKVDLVIKEAENPHWSDSLFGSNDVHLLRKCPCPLLLTKPNRPLSGYKNILATIDFGLFEQQSHLNDKICQMAFQIALGEFAQLHIANAWDIPYAGFASIWGGENKDTEARMWQGEQQRRYRQIEQVIHPLVLQTEGFTQPQIHLPQGKPVDVLPPLIASHEIDLVVMGTLSRTGISGMLIGNTSEEIISQLDCSVLALKPDHFETPVTLASS